MELVKKEGTHRTNRKFTAQEDALLKKLVHEMGENCWNELASKMKRRNARQCHDRWFNYLSPKINNSPWTPEEDEMLINLCYSLNGKWVKVSKRVNGRTDTQIKNRWNTLKKIYPLPKIEKKAENPNITFQDIVVSQPKETEVIPKKPKPTENMPDNIFEQLTTIFNEGEKSPIDIGFDFLN